MKQKLSPQENRRAWCYAALIVVILLALCAGAYALISHKPEPPVRLPAASGALMQAAEGLDDIRVTAGLDTASQLLTVTQEMRLRNRTGQDQDAVVLRSWSGAYLSEETSPAASLELFYDSYGAAFDAGGLQMKAAAVNGTGATWTWLDGAFTVLSLPAEWAADAILTVTLQYEVEIPDCASRFGYVKDADSGSSCYMLGNVFPLPAVWEDGAWRTDAYIPIGDPFLSECANWDVTLSVPSGYTAAASVWAEPVIKGDRSICHYTGYAMRDFAIVVSDGFVSAQGMAGDVLVTAYACTGQEAQRALRYARQALQSYAKRWGAYPWPTYTVAGVIFPHGGMEYPGMAMIAAELLREGGSTLEYVIAHETAHQWWAMLVGSDSWYQAWQDESLCEYAYLDYAGDWYGAAQRESVAFERIETSLRITVPRGVTPGSPIDYFSGLTEYAMVVYQQGAALWHALETYMGKDALDALLRDYRQQFGFRIASREDLTQLISRHAGQDMSGLMLDYLDTCK